MLRYQSRQHKFLMQESEQALADAAEGNSRRETRIAKQILTDPKLHRLWESRHADLMTPVAEHQRRTPQIYALRTVEVQLLHRRALIKYIRRFRIAGKKRDNLFSVFYGPREKSNAILAEHRQYTISVSSRLGVDHLISVMQDPISVRLINQYELVYSRYFELYCNVMLCDDPIMAEATKVEMLELRRRALQLIKQMNKEPPCGEHYSFERQALIARSGRYPILEYMVG